MLWSFDSSYESLVGVANCAVFRGMRIRGGVQWMVRGHAGAFSYLVNDMRIIMGLKIRDELQAVQVHTQRIFVVQRF